MQNLQDAKTLMVRRAAMLLGLALLLVACSSPDRRFPLRDPLSRDTDLDLVTVACREDPTPKEPKHVTCAPKPYVSPFAWDAANNTLFRPLSQAFAVDPAREAPNVTSFDEVPDSAWFTNRIGRHAMTPAEVAQGACSPAMFLDGETAADGSWVIDRGKTDGASPGFRVRIPGKGKYLFKADGKDTPERNSAASVIGAAMYHATGYYTSCEQVVYFKRSVLKLTPGLTFANNSGVMKTFDQAALEKVLGESTKKGELVRMQASAWLPGHLLGPFRYESTRDDDPNDAIPHEDRRELRGARLLAAWVNHFDSREQNSMDSWISTKKSDPEGSPGFVRHYYLDQSDSFGSEWAWDEVSRRLGHSYLLDFEDVGEDFVTLGLMSRPWERAQRTPGAEPFGYYSVRDFDPERWKNEYPNPAFSRMTERDGAWMARILAHYTPEMIRALAQAGRFSEPRHTEYLATTLQGRLDRILARYLTRLSPITDFTVEGDQLCGVDLARLRRVRDEAAFRYSSELRLSRPELPVPLVPSAMTDGRVCVTLPHVAADGGLPDNALRRYVMVVLRDGVAASPVVAHLYDLGSRRGFRLVGIERPAS
jgi:hypothetical protein